MLRLERVRHSAGLVALLLATPHLPLGDLLADPSLRLLRDGEGWQVAAHIVRLSENHARECMRDIDLARTPLPDGRLLAELCIETWESCASEALQRPEVAALRTGDGASVRGKALRRKPSPGNALRALQQ